MVTTTSAVEVEYYPVQRAERVGGLGFCTASDLLQLHVVSKEYSAVTQAAWKFARRRVVIGAKWYGINSRPNKAALASVQVELRENPELLEQVE